ncbi:uncharacterized protein [Rutidosis leptorrhynchoides]|uniref:uncharacterized protein n=1 Tax=Rutidosis leptorrhynchoides TaxID=125765 RepID=UPI003A9983A5
MAGDMVNHFQVQFLAIQETMVKKVSQPILNSIWKNQPFQYVQVGSTGRSGGLLSIWREDVFTLLNQWSNRYWIASLLRYIPNQKVLFIIIVYDPQHEQDKNFVWNQIITMANLWSSPICVLGDFNSVCKEEERFRENIHPAELINFNNFILSANLIDQPLSNDEFTWEGPEGKQSCIDRILWSSMDHDGWNAFVLMKKLWSLKGELRLWKNQQFYFSKNIMNQCEAEIKQIKDLYKIRNITPSESILLVNCKNKKKQLVIRDEAKKRLHSHITWLKLGDKNTRFFSFNFTCQPAIKFN